MNGSRKLRVGMIVDDNDQSALTWEIFRRGQAAEFYEITALIVNRSASVAPQQGRLSRLAAEARTRGGGQLLRKIGYGLLLRLEKAAVARNPAHQEFFKQYPLEAFGVDKIYVSPTISPSGLIYSYPESELEKIRAAGFDVIVRCGGGILKGPVLQLCRFGVLSYHHADNDINRGGPAGFWEVFHKQASTGFIIQRLTEELDGGDVLLKGSVATSPLYLLNQIKLYSKSAVFMHLLLERAGREDRLPPVQPKRPYAYQLYKLPDVSQQFRYFLHFCRFAAGAVLNKILNRTHRWGVAYLFADNWRAAVLRKVTVIKNPPGHFLADPFVIERGGEHFCFVEDFDYQVGRASIEVYKITRSGYSHLGSALKEDFHLSFPFLFEADGELYMCPETVQANEIRVYKCVEFPLGWKLHKVLMRDVRAADTCVFKHGEKWWLLTNADSSDTSDYGSELHAFSADSFDSDNWTPHPANPLIFDSARARNGGMIFDDGGIFRVFQVQGFDLYGEAMGIARITELSDTAYSEEVVAEIPAKFMDGISGTHTLAFSEGLLALDVVRHERTSH